MSSGCEVAVIGAGIIGLAIAVELTERGVDVLCIDHGVPGGGKSQGVVRIFRHRHATVAEVERAAQARELWDRWSAQAGCALIGAEGHLYMAPDAAEVQELLARGGVRADMISAGAAMARWPDLRVGHMGVFEHAGGSIHAASAVTFLRGRLADRVRAGHIHAVAADGHIDSDRMLQAEHVIIAAGVGTWDLARGAGMDLPLALLPHLRLTVPCERPLPTLSIRQERASLYASPTPDGRHLAVGVAGASAREIIHGALAEILPAVSREEVGDLPCVQTSSALGDDALFITTRGRVTAAVGGNMFKWAPLVARDVAAALA